LVAPVINTTTFAAEPQIAAAVEARAWSAPGAEPRWAAEPTLRQDTEFFVSTTSGTRQIVYLHPLPSGQYFSDSMDSPSYVDLPAGSTVPDPERGTLI